MGITPLRVKAQVPCAKLRLERYLRLQLAIAVGITALLAACSLNGPSRAPEQAKTAKQAEKGAGQLDATQAERIRRIMVPLIQNMKNPVPLNEVRLTVVDDPAINAANAGKGQFFVTTGLLEKANDDQLRGVLAHEVAHEDLGHVAKTKVLGTGLSIGALILDQFIPGSGLIAPTVANLAVMQPFSRQEEYQADAHGVEILNRAGYNGKQVMAGTLIWLLQKSGPSGGFLTDHPGTEERIKRIQQLP
jgi:Zn-dependent protease with chaperone function